MRQVNMPVGACWKSSRNVIRSGSTIIGGAASSDSATGAIANEIKMEEIAKPVISRGSSRVNQN
jgi:hypothetical protein